MIAAFPIAPEEFAGLMSRLGPFEAAPALALAVSGGADSMALALLASAWAAGRGGTATALIVDHRLRHGSTAEAELTRERLHARGIAAEILTRTGDAPPADIQAFARQARYGLLTRWCRDKGVLHLITAHHREDQAETLLLRLARGSGLAGLAAMPEIAHLDTCRLLRPFLNIAPSRLRATLRAVDAEWVEDPSNTNDAFARVRLRNHAGNLAALGFDPARLAATAHHLGRARAAIEDQVARLLAASVVLHPAGFATLALPGFVSASPEIALRALAALVTCIGGQSVTPRLERLEALRTALSAAGATARTLSGCRIVSRGDTGLVFREFAAIAPARALDGPRIRWDGRFLIQLAGAPPPLDDLTIGALGMEQLATVKRLVLGGGKDIPARVWPTLPTLRRQGTILAVPHLAWAAPEAADVIGPFDVLARFCPERALTECGFTVV